MAGEERHDAEANRKALERTAVDNERIRAMQPEQIPLEDGVPKQQLGLVSAYVVNAIAMLLPIRMRIRFVFAINFLYNNVRASLRYALASVGQYVTGGAIALAYFTVLGPSAWVARMLGADYLGTSRDGASFFTVKEPADTTEERFLRQY